MESMGALDVIWGSAALHPGFMLSPAIAGQVSLLRFENNLAVDDGHHIARLQDLHLGNLHDVG